MKLLYDFIIESLIGSTELDKDLKFVECSEDDMADILDTDEYEHGTVLGMTMEDIEEGNMFGGYDSTYYKIQYKDKVLGMFGIIFPEKMVTFIDTESNNKNTHKQLTWDLWKALVGNSLEEKNQKYDILKLDPRNYKHNTTIKNICQHVLYNTAYITMWVINQHVKKEIDVNDFALVKLFFKKLMKLATDHNAKYVWAHGKDERTQKMYIKLGGFIDPSPIVDDYYKSHSKFTLQTLHDTMLRGIVWKCINENAKLRQVPDSIKLPIKNTSISNKSENTSKNPYSIRVEGIDPNVQKVILYGIRLGYIIDNGSKYGVSKENIVKFHEITDNVSKEKIQELVKKYLDEGFKFKYETDDEWKKAGYEDPFD